MVMVTLLTKKRRALRTGISDLSIHHRILELAPLLPPGVCLARGVGL